jgi:glucose/arabinose dehydrogenase
MQLKHKNSLGAGQWFRLLLSLLSLVAITGQPTLIPPDFAVAFVGEIGNSAGSKMAIAKDGRIFISEKVGRIWIIEDGVKQETAFLDMFATTPSFWEYGFFGMIFDPDFDTNGWFYLFYTTDHERPHDRVGRFTANADRTFADPDTEFVLHEFESLVLDNHLGGAMDLHPDGTLFITHGDNSLGYPSQV